MFEPENCSSTTIQRPSEGTIFFETNNQTASKANKTKEQPTTKQSSKRAQESLYRNVSIISVVAPFPQQIQLLYITFCQILRTSTKPKTKTITKTKKNKKTTKPKKNIKKTKKLKQKGENHLAFFVARRARDQRHLCQDLTAPRPPAPPPTLGAAGERWRDGAKGTGGMQDPFFGCFGFKALRLGVLGVLGVFG